MADDPIPAEVRDFILRHIDSVAQLEALLLLLRNPKGSWTVARTAQRLYAPEQEIADVLARLREDGLVSVNDGGYRYDCASPEQSALIERLAEVYARHLIPMTNMIHAKPRRIREFADAFKLRKDR
jgi:hypothetical protein